MKSGQIFRIALWAMWVFALQANGRAADKDGGFVLYPGASGSPGPVIFSHQVHGIRGAGFACDKCHAPESPKTMVFTMDGIRQGQVCGSCHDGKTAGPRGRLAAASVQDCTACHMPAADIVITLNRMDPVAFSHVRHLGVDPKQKTSKPAGFSCVDCHPAPFERIAKGPIGMKVPHENGGCASCHNGQKRGDGNAPAFAATTRCLTCHKPM
jgi:c(7)-type cytochrome triheme protein